MSTRLVRTSPIVLTPLLVVLLLAGAASAQQGEVDLEKPEPSQGHYIALGIGEVRAQAYDESRGLRKPTHGSAFELRLGQSVTSWADLGIAFWVGKTDGDDEHKLTFGGVRVQGQVYPTQRLFLRGGFGPFGASGTDPLDPDYSRGTYGVACDVGAGLNIFLSDEHESGGWVLTPTLMNHIGHNAGIEQQTFTTHMMTVGLQLSWWSGLPRDQLDLSIDRAYVKEAVEVVKVREANNVIYGDFGGYGIESSIYYERIFGDMAPRVGIGYKEQGNADENVDRGTLTMVPVGVSYLGFGSKHVLEVGAGGTLVFAEGEAEQYGVDAEGSGFGGWGGVNVGYRRQPLDGGFVFRAGVTQLITPDGFKMPVYLSAGGAF
jgi:hypothetical protein